MKYLYLLLSLSIPLNFVAAQSVTVGNISKLTLCVGDTVWVPYTSNGLFQADNFFAAQLSDASGSFTTFTNIGHFTNTRDSIPVKIISSGDHFRVRVIATDSYIVSSNTSSDIQVLNYPSPKPAPLIKATNFGYAAFVGDAIQFTDATAEASGSKYLWTFDQDANITISSNSSPTVTYSSDGIKSGMLTVFNSAGCSTSISFRLIILSCNPLIPDTAHIVTGTESGNYDYVWVKAGGNYTVNNTIIGSGGSKNIVFAESGASVTTTSLSLGTYFLKTGVSFSWDYNSNALLIVNKGNPISFKDDLHHIDILYCDNLQFDYNEISAREVLTEEHPLQIQNSPNNLRVSCEAWRSQYRS